MKCKKCGEDKPYLEMQPFPITDSKGNTIQPRQTYLVCPKCLGWEPSKSKLADGEILIKIS